MKNKSILLVDDENILLEIISHDLKNLGYLVNTAKNAEEGMKKFKDIPFDLVITDLVMEGDDGIQLSKKIKEINPDTEIIILTGYPSTISAIDALKLGACDYLLKPCEKKELFKSIEECLKNKEHPNRERKKFNFNRVTKKAGLTPREMEICELIKIGKSNSEISSHYHISQNTTKNHIKQIHQKLQVTSRGQLVSLLNQ